jgi:adenylate cyclase
MVTSESQPPGQPVGGEHEALWREVLTKGHPGRWAFLPADPRCIVCQQPFQGLGGAFLRMLKGYRVSRMSPNVCNICEDLMPSGGAEVDVAVLFADMRGSTALGERLGPTAYAELLNRFYRATSHVLVAAESWINNLVGDEIVALYIPAMGPEYRQRAVTAGVQLLNAVGYKRGEEPWLPVGVGVNAGLAFVGKVGTSGTNQVTALGDTVNTAARMQAAAAPGELLVSEELYRSVASEYPAAEQRTLDLRGKEQSFPVRVLRPAQL